MRVDDKSKVTADSVTVYAYVSFDKGISYVLQGQYKMGPMGGTGTYVSLQTIPFAPRMYITAQLSTAQALAAGSGIAVDLEFEEYQPEQYKTVIQPAWYNTSGTLVGATSPDTKSMADSAYTRYSSTMTLSQFSRPQRVAIVGYAADRSKIAATGSNVMWLQTSLDGTHWYNADSIWVAKPTNGTGIFLSSEEAKPVPVYTVTNNAGAKEPGIAKQGVLSKYIRIAIGPKYASALSTGANIRFWFIAYY